MAGITLKEYGLTFVWACLREYLGASWPFLLIFGLGILAGILMPHLKKKKEAELEVVDAKDYVPGKYEDNLLPDASGTAWMFLSIVLFCVLTVMNPFLVRYLIPKFGMTTVYYRFFWILPITFGAAYFLARLIGSVRKRLVQAIVCAVICAALAWAIPLNPGIRNMHIPSSLPTNVYKVDGAVPVLCDAIHKDFETTRTCQEAAQTLAEITDRNSKAWIRATGRQYPLCVFPYGIEFAVRQYDPTIRLLFNRNLRLYYEGNRSTGITYDTSKKRYMKRKRILDAMYGRDPELTMQDFRSAMEDTQTKYMIVEENLANGSFLVDAGCTQVGIVAGYTIFRYGD